MDDQHPKPTRPVIAIAIGLIIFALSALLAWWAGNG